MKYVSGEVRSFAAFLAVVAATLEPLGIVPSFALALAAVVVVQAIELRSAFRLHGPSTLEQELLPEAGE